MDSLPRSASLVVIVLSTLASVAGAFWTARKAAARRRKTEQILHDIAEDLTASGSPRDLVGKLNAGLPAVSPGLQSAAYVYNRGSKALELVSSSIYPSSISIRTEGPQSGLAAGIALCYRNRMAIHVPDTRRSPLLGDQEKAPTPRSVIFLPMLSQNEMVGVLEVHHAARRRTFGEDERGQLQHVANQAGAALRLLEQKSARERMFRTEKMAAAAQLISGIAAELRSPLGSIIELAGTLKSRQAERGGAEIDRIEAEALRAAEIVSRLVGFSKAEQTEVQQVDLHALLTKLIRLRAYERKPAVLATTVEFLPQRILVLGAPPQMEQLFLTLMVHAEREALSANEPAIAISTSLLARRIVVQIDYPTPPNGDASRHDVLFDHGAPDGSPLGLSLCRGIAQGHGGDVRFARVSAKRGRVDVDLPVVETQQLRVANSMSGPRGSRRQLTALIVEPDLKTQRQIVEALGARGDRAVPMQSVEEAAELARRMHFDLVFCSTRTAGWTWVEFFEQVRAHIGVFVLLSQGYHPELAKTFHNGEGVVLSKPVEDAQLQRICDGMAERARGAHA